MTPSNPKNIATDRGYLVFVFAESLLALERQCKWDGRIKFIWFAAREVEEGRPLDGLRWRWVPCEVNKVVDRLGESWGWAESKALWQAGGDELGSWLASLWAGPKADAVEPRSLHMNRNLVRGIGNKLRLRGEILYRAWACVRNMSRIR